MADKITITAPGTSTTFNPETGRNDIYISPTNSGDKHGHIIIDGNTGKTEYRRDPGPAGTKASTQTGRHVSR